MNNFTHQKYQIISDRKQRPKTDFPDDFHLRYDTNQPRNASANICALIWTRLSKESRRKRFPNAARLWRIADLSRASTFYRASSRPVDSLAKIDFSRFSAACISLGTLESFYLWCFRYVFAMDVLYALLLFEMTVLIDDYPRLLAGNGCMLFACENRNSFLNVTDVGRKLYWFEIRLM